MKELPKVLIFIDWYLPGYKAGGPIRSCANLVSHLKGDYSFYVITRNTDYTDTTPYATVVSDEWNDVDGTRVCYLSGRSTKAKKLRALIREVNPAVVYINGIYSFYFSILPVILSKQLGYRRILVAGRGMLARSAIQVKGAKKGVFFRLARFFKLYRHVTFHATNAAEEADIREVLGDRVAIKVAPNLPETISSSQLQHVVRPKQAGELRLVSMARIAPEKNTKFALELLTGFKGPGRITFDLYGPVYNEAYWQECEALLTMMPSNITVQFKGSIEKHRVPEILQQYHALFMPTQGENFGHIILESFTAGCPVLISDRTPWRNLTGAGAGYDIPLSDKAAYHDAMAQLTNLNQEQYNALSEKAFRFGMQYCQDEANLSANKELFKF